MARGVNHYLANSIHAVPEDGSVLPHRSILPNWFSTGRLDAYTRSHGTTCIGRANPPAVHLYVHAEVLKLLIFRRLEAQYLRVV